MLMMLVMVTIANDGDNGSSTMSSFVASSNFLTTTPLNVILNTTQSFAPPPSSTLNVVFNTTQSFIPPPYSTLPSLIQLTLPSSAYYPPHQYSVTLENI
jgi:hypothetical protein